MQINKQSYNAIDLARMFGIHFTGIQYHPIQRIS